MANRGANTAEIAIRGIRMGDLPELTGRRRWPGDDANATISTGYKWARPKSYLVGAGRSGRRWGHTLLARSDAHDDDGAPIHPGCSIMEFGSFMEFPPVASGDQSAAFDQALAEVETAERVGLDAVWLAELHGAPERSVMSAPMMVAATPETFPKIGALGLPIFVAVRQGPFSKLAVHIRA